MSSGMTSCAKCGQPAGPVGDTCVGCGAIIERIQPEFEGAVLAEKYSIEHYLGSGGMCEVFRGRHLKIEKAVAIKMLKSHLAADPDIARRFEDEARAASRIHHPNAISVTDFGVWADDQPFMVMELVDGQTLGDLLRKDGAMTVERVAGILRQVSGALDAAHAVGVVHRDIKPDNIIVSSIDGTDWVKVVDFGVAKIQEDLKRDPTLTGANFIVGTPRYMSPEQCEERSVDSRSDIYSLGVVVYEMLSGEAPFAGSSSTRLMMAHCGDEPVPLSEKRPDIPRELAEVVMTALEKQPSSRPQTAGQYSRQFEEAAGLIGVSHSRVDSGAAFSRIAVPLSNQESQVNLEEIDDTEATVVRPRPGGTPVEMEPLAGNSGQLHRGSAGLIIGVLLIVLLVAGIAGYLMFGDRLFGYKSYANAINEAQRAVTDAIARVESLPAEHQLRTYLPQLAKWQGELEAYEKVENYTDETARIAAAYEERAAALGGQARIALAPSPRHSSGSAAEYEEAAGKSASATDETRETDPEAEVEAELPEKKTGEGESKGREATKTRQGAPVEPPMTQPVKPTRPEKKKPPANL